mmetsp:Transcript_23624/g.46416  ORF Transcript_23624/g.46416 Transcript_23624/m.46416 type:complete len:229 (+) Transcript_23624:610-1296(+)
MESRSPQILEGIKPLHSSFDVYVSYIWFAPPSAHTMDEAASHKNGKLAGKGMFRTTKWTLEPASPLPAPPLSLSIGEIEAAVPQREPEEPSVAASLDELDAGEAPAERAETLSLSLETGRLRRGLMLSAATSSGAASASTGTGKRLRCFATPLVIDRGDVTSDAGRRRRSRNEISTKFSVSRMVSEINDKRSFVLLHAVLPPGPLGPCLLDRMTAVKSVRLLMGHRQN